jgi:hypothetical protein
MNGIDEAKMIPWSIQQETELFRALCQYKPVGLHKHFRMISIIGFLANSSPSPHHQVTDIWEKLKTLYDLEGLDQLEYSNSNGSEDASGDEGEDEAKPAEESFEDFDLPFEEYGELMEKQAMAEEPESPSDKVSTPQPIGSKQSDPPQSESDEEPAPVKEEAASSPASDVPKYKRGRAATRSKTTRAAASKKTAAATVKEEAAEERETSKTPPSSRNARRRPASSGTRRSTRKR